MWANVGPDSTVMMGFKERGSEKLNFILDKDLGQLKTGDIQVGECLNRSKISFHKSGHYKLSTCVGLGPSSIDRCTVIGTPLAEIEEPRRMMEIIIPKELRTTNNQPRERDIVLEAAQFPNRPLCCTISCMSHKKFHEIMESKVLFVDTSEAEFTRALDSGEHVWTWTLRVSRENKIAPDHFHYFLFGEMRWGKECPDKSTGKGGNSF
jgi:hypothetical protein